MSRQQADQGGRALSLLRRVWVVLVCATLVAALAVGWARSAREHAANRVALVVDGREVQRMAAAAGLTFDAYLSALKDAGVHAVGVHEYTLRDAIADGRVFLVSKRVLELVDSRLAGALPRNLPATTLILGHPRSGHDESDLWLTERLERLLTPMGQRIEGVFAFDVWQLPRDELPLDVPLGFLPEVLRAVGEAGLGVVPRIASDAHAREIPLIERVHQLRPYAVPAVIFWGTRVNGYPHQIPSSADSLKRLAAPIGLVEFAQQAGMSAMAKEWEYRIVRVHSITEREMAVPIGMDVALDRWLRAARERGVRLFYTRLYFRTPPEERTLARPAVGRADHVVDEGTEAPERLATLNIEYLEELATRLRAEGFRLGNPAEVPWSPANLWAIALGVLVVGGAVGRLAACVAPRLGLRNLNNIGVAVVWIVGSLGTTLLFWALWFKGYTVLARQAGAFAAAIAFPTLAVYGGWRWAREVAAPAKSLSATLRVTVLAFVRAVGWTLLGAGTLVLLLDDVRFAATLEGFRGVKAAHVLPLLLVATLLWPARWVASRATPPLVGLPAKQAGADGGLRRLGWIVLGALGALMLTVYVLRTGNQGLPLWEVEGAVRRLLEETFGARPRTKEFLIGHPGLVLALFLVPISGRRPFVAVAAAVIGAIGQISMMNTFAHVHSPLTISLARTGYGFLLGVFLGVVTSLLLWAAAEAWRRRSGVGRTGRRRSVECG